MPTVSGIPREVGTTNLLAKPELTLVLEGIDLRQECSRQQEFLMRVEAPDGS